MAGTLGVQLAEVPEVVELDRQLAERLAGRVHGLDFVRWSIAYRSVDACPIDRTNRSRLGQIGSSGLTRRNRCHSVYPTGAVAIGVPGCPEFAYWTASMHRVRIVAIASRSGSEMATRLMRGSLFAGPADCASGAVGLSSRQPP
jgi:hypothetical protein